MNLSEREHTRACLINAGNDAVAGGDCSTHLGGKELLSLASVSRQGPQQ